MKKEQNIALKTMGIKSKLVNFLRTELHPYSKKPYEINHKGKKEITDKVKLEIFDIMYQKLIETNNELFNYKLKRKRKSEVERLRNEKKEKNFTNIL